jgi:ABC-type Zn uptake system ZnuABC Zn-binding protein ZnuA
VVTFPPLYSFARSVLGDQGTVLCLCLEKGPHHYEVEAADIMKLRDADLFFANGLLLDDRHFANSLQLQSGNPRLRYLKLGDALPPDLLLKTRHEDDDPDEGGHEHEHGEYDPHVWLGIPQAVGMVEKIRDDLKKADPEHAQEYDANAKAYVQVLCKLHQEGKEKLKAKKDRKVVSFHESLAYFARSFGLEVVGSIEQGAGDEPTGQRLSHLVQLCQKKGVSVIAVEPQYPRTTSADKLHAELKKKGSKVEIVVVDPLETARPGELDGDWYRRKMWKNINNLFKGLP